MHGNSGFLKHYLLTTQFILKNPILQEHNSDQHPLSDRRNSNNKFTQNNSFNLLQKGIFNLFIFFVLLGKIIITPGFILWYVAFYDNNETRFNEKCGENGKVYFEWMASRVGLLFIDLIISSSVGKYIEFCFAKTSSLRTFAPFILNCIIFASLTIIGVILTLNFVNSENYKICKESITYEFFPNESFLVILGWITVSTDGMTFLLTLTLAFVQCFNYKKQSSFHMTPPRHTQIP